MYYGKTYIGTLYVPEGLERTRSDYETASWWTTYRLKPGPVPLVASFYSGWREGVAEMDAAWVCASIPAVVLDEYKPSSWGGVPTGGPTKDPGRVGAEELYHLQTYAHSCKQLAEGRLWDMPVALLPGVRGHFRPVVERPDRHPNDPTHLWTLTVRAAGRQAVPEPAPAQRYGW